jgi:hypothetical protein
MIQKLSERLREKPPHLGDIGDEEEGFCDDPTHPEDCTCGADPDHEYEKEKERRAEERMEES